LSFFDEREDRPARRRPPPRGPGTDRQTLLVRRVVAGVVGFVVLLLLIFGIRGCLNSRKEQAFKDYGRDVGALIQESDQQSKSLYELLGDPADRSPVDVESAINGFRADAAQLVDRAKDTDHPDDVNSAHRYLVQTLEFRRDGIGAIARELPSALAERGRSEASRRIAAQMQNFLASDVIYSQRVVPDLQGELKDEDLLDEVNVPRSQFLPDIEWLSATTVTDRIAGGGGAGDRAATPGTHGNGLGTVTVMPRGIQLVEGQAAQVPASEDLAFDVQVQNQGENDERDVTVKVTISGDGDPIEREERLDEIAAGEEKVVSIPLADQPPTGRPVTIRVEIEPVPGEDKTDNNRGSFSAVFSE
jgi:hypothetical protein